MLYLESIPEENLDNLHTSPEQHDVESTGSTKTPEKRIDGSLRRSERLRHTENLQSSAMGAGPYFQFHMANTIFPDLIYKILEVYLDDIIS